MQLVKEQMTEIIRNILAFSSTFVVITFTCAIIFQIVACAFNKGRVNDKMKKNGLICGLIIACILIPFYYLPA